MYKRRVRQKCTDFKKKYIGGLPPDFYALLKSASPRLRFVRGLRGLLEAPRGSARAD